MINVQTLQFADVSMSLAVFVASGLYTATSQGQYFHGGIGWDTFIAGPGNDTFDGQGGINTVQYAGASTSYVVYSDGSGGYYVEDPASGSGAPLFDHLLNIQSLQFSNQTVNPTSLVVGQYYLASSGPNTLLGGTGSDWFVGGSGEAVITGGAGGSSTVAYSGPQAEYQIYADGSGGVYVVDTKTGAGATGVQHLTNITTLQFTDVAATPSATQSASVISAPGTASVITGAASGDLIIDNGGAGESITGGGGYTVVEYSGWEVNYTVYSDGSGGYYLETNALGPELSQLDHLVNVSALQFADQSAAPSSLSIGQVYQLTANASLSLTSGLSLVYAGLGGDTINGGSGSTTVVYSGKEAQYQVFSDGSGGYYVESQALGTSPASFDHLTNVTALQFADQSAAPAALSIGQLLTASTANASVSLSSGTNIVIDAGLGGDTINGGSGSTTVAYGGKEAQYEVFSDGSGGYYVESQALGANPATFDRLMGVTTLQFADASAALSSLSIGQLLTASTANASVSLTSGTNIVVDAGLGGDTINGGSGSTTVVYSGTEAQYEVFSGAGHSIWVESQALGSNPASFDHLINVTTLQFADQSATASSLSVGQLVNVKTANRTVTPDLGNQHRHRRGPRRRQHQRRLRLHHGGLRRQGGPVSGPLGWLRRLLR